MAKASFLKSGAFAALAAGLALVILPVEAMAQERGQGRWSSSEARGEQRSDGGEGRRSMRGSSARSERAQPTPQQAAPQAAPAPQAAQQQWSDRGGRNRGEDGNARVRNWQGRGEASRPAPAVDRAPPVIVNQAEQRVSRSGWQGGNRYRAENTQSQPNREWAGRETSNRNRTYADPDRNRTYRDGNRDTRQESQWRDRRNDGQTYNDHRRDGRRDGRWNDHNDNRRWDNNWRRDRRYDWSSYRNTNRHIYRSGRYYSPYRNYYYRPLSIGFYLDSLFFGSRYWISDPEYYRLPPAYGPYRWVRYYDDVLLVEIYSGEVVDVIHNFFW